jgi:hypothetical protein
MRPVRLSSGQLSGSAPTCSAVGRSVPSGGRYWSTYCIHTHSVSPCLPQPAVRQLPEDCAGHTGGRHESGRGGEAARFKTAGRPPAPKQASSS